MTNILLVTTWDTACGIAEHSAMLKGAVEAADQTLHVEPFTDLHPHPVVNRYQVGPAPDILHLNYHAALHSQWTPDYIRVLQTQFGAKVVVTYHDTGVPNSNQCKALYEVADAFIVHEPAEDLPEAHYVRMGVPDWPGPSKRLQRRPWLGTIGFPFPWKNYDQLCVTTAAQGWGLLLIAPTASVEQYQHWLQLNPNLSLRSEFVARPEAVSMLADCDATAFAYVCHNAGQSGAILQGIATRKPVIAMSTCRQFRALFDDPLGREAICWAESFDDVARHLRTLPIQRVDPGMVALAEQESWSKVGQKYVEIYKRLL